MPGSSLIDRCLEKGITMTHQRRVIADVIDAATDHPDVQEIHRRASENDPNISIPTVYRTMSLFQEHHVVEEHRFGSDRARYEAIQDDHHDHLIDVKSGKVIEFQNEEIERLQRAIAKELGYKLVDHRLELYGIPLTDKEE